MKGLNMSKFSFLRHRKPNRRSRNHAARFVEVLEVRRMLTIMGTLNGNTVEFAGDAAAETASLTMDASGYLALNGSTDLDDDGSFNDLLVAEITSLTYDDNGGNDTLLFEGTAGFNFSSAPTISIGETNAIHTLIVSQNVTLAGTGMFAAEAARNIVMNSGSSLTTVLGDISFRANLGLTPQEGDFSGIELNNADISTADGDIRLEGRGGDNAATGFHRGVYLHAGALVVSTGVGPGAGTITLIGTGGAGTSLNIGVEIADAGSLVSSIDGDIAIVGTGGAGTTNSNQGVRRQLVFLFSDN
jgi:hypothetical protein